MKTFITKSLLLFLLCFRASGQDFYFSNLNAADGLSDNFVRSIAIDKSGFLWIGTNFGLNSYDGYSITNYSEYDYPDIPGRSIVKIFCDKENTLWFGSAEGACYADSRRAFHRIVLQDSIKKFSCRYIVQSGKYGVILFTDRGQFVQDIKTRQWRPVSWKNTPVPYKKLTEVINYDDDRIIITSDSTLYLLDYARHKIVFEKSVPGLLNACRLANGRIALTTTGGIIQVLDMPSGNIIHQADLNVFSREKNRTSTASEIRPAAGGHIVIASSAHGFFIIDSNFSVARPSYDESDPNSIATDRIQKIATSQDGNIVLGTFRKGVITFNVLKKKAAQKRLFRDSKQSVYEGPVNEIAEDKAGTLWLGGNDRLIKWDRKTGNTEFIRFGNAADNAGIPNPEVYRVCLDKNDQLWISLMNTGVAVVNKNTGAFTRINTNANNSPSVRSNRFYKLCAASDNRIWVAGESGIFAINSLSKKIETFDEHPLLKNACTYITHNITEDGKKRIWFSTRNHGLFCYNPANNTIRQYGVKDGLMDSTCFELFKDSRGNIYVTMNKGFQVISGDRVVRSYTRNNGLRYDGVNAIMEDNDGMIWVTNIKALIRLNPETGKTDVFEGESNFYNGFINVSGIKLSTGGFVLGTQTGINHFIPAELSAAADPLSVSVFKVQAGDSVFTGISDDVASIRYRNNNLQFDFTSINLLGSLNIQYKFMLEGYDRQWQVVKDIRQARYSSLPPNRYTFRLKASINGKDWVESANSFSFIIIRPVHMRWWFRLAVLLCFAAALYYFLQRRNNILKQKKEELEAEKAINYFSSSLYEHHTSDDILWDVARNCIGRLHFEDCVVYMLDKDKNVLVQKAAHGPKSPRTFEITQPLDIPLGKGIVGSVAKNIKAEIINDTSKDSRYIADDAVRLSEIAVPIISDGRLLGVIDCEHSKKGFFTQKHLSILTTIASLCASKITRAKTEAEKRETEKMLADTKQKMAEAEMQALRAQMNPHFIFNCLNSINRYIVKSDQATASLYLTRFAKLIRLILDNSHSKNVLLVNETEALRLYIDMESLRFDNKFTYEIKTDDNVPADTIEVPPLIIQPYIENAIWHGLLHKPEAGHLRVHISLFAGSVLQCVIEDNGVGREKAAELKSKSATKKKSLGMELTENRLLLLNQYASVQSSVEIEDMKDEYGNATGTRVILKIPFGDA